MNEKDVTRRDFLKLITNGLLTLSGLLGLGGIFRFLTYQTDPSPPTEFDLGPTTNYPDGSRTVLPRVPAVLLHTKDGYSALSLVCTHLGCTVNEDDSDGYVCPCHTSRFSANGSVVRGPADRPLRALRVEEHDDGRLWLYTA
ncbi:MAG: Rieske (2Fe-2S) protein [Chloroflexi bacterium]|nr:Rieske (2Fe-2S) protein [Chloroflexota bacterium]